MHANAIRRAGAKCKCVWPTWPTTPSCIFPQDELNPTSSRAIVGPMGNDSGKRIWLFPATVLGIWLILAVVLSLQAFLLVEWALRAQDDVKHLRPAAGKMELFLSVLVDCLVWAPLTIGIFWLGRR